MSDAEKLPPTSLRLLEIFAAMMVNRTTVATAESLGISQPAVSAGLRQLESQLELTLFDRTGRHLEPTLDAANLYEEIRPLFGIVRSFSMRARDLRSGRAGRLRVVATPPPGYSITTLALRNLVETRPDVLVSYDVRRLESVLHAVQTGQADIGVGLAADRVPSVTTEQLKVGRMVLLLPGDHRLAPLDQVEIADLLNESFIGIDQASHLGRIVAGAFETARVSYRPRLETRYCQTAASLVARGLGVSIIDPWSAQPFLGQAPGENGMHGRAGLVIRPLTQDCTVRCMMFTRRGVPHSRLLTRFMDELRRAVDSVPDVGMPAPTAG